ncbi:hypothetical protein ACFVZH_36580 [Streptomyces sp. NPDC059534]|uniref:hypothetical protein n=1 Tax=Streptomyces sp. NPDC059534 TaxID=3346859 RepID=UPI0036A0A8B3
MSACSAFRESHGDPDTWSAQTIDAYLDACLADRRDKCQVKAEVLVEAPQAKEVTR